MVDRRRGGLGSSALRQALPYQFPSRSSCIGLCACFVARPHQSTQSKHHLSLLHTCKNAQAAAQTTKSLLSGITINAINCPNFGPGSRSSPVPLEPSPASLPPICQPIGPGYSHAREPAPGSQPPGQRTMDDACQTNNPSASESWSVSSGVCDRRTCVVTDCT